MLRIKSETLNGRRGHDVGRLLLSRMYREETGLEPPEIITMPRGKPCFCSSSLHFSISHTKNHVFCALSDCPVGIDAEELDRAIDLRLAEKILSPSEYRRFQCTPNKQQALLRYWVLKEASAKLSGEGLKGYPNYTDFSPDDPRIQTMDGCLVAIIQQEETHAL